ncbi:hypothetical protein Drose_19820 [Dactylosporangium roseum]|uniref:Uncharacterized protein n=1 Tax=Dactylosporangium roseum TaxID=47989 RepID=A0ABY5YV06_9ACTN|nr:hypothetical protein [Dactylosporangium roseum]UWZ33560.1 hypothetical protein Drose_19820 [Dactylosporangium roseum]
MKHIMHAEERQREILRIARAQGRVEMAGLTDELADLLEHDLDADDA